MKEVDSIDILFLGNSQAYRGFDTRAFEKLGIRSFNLGTSGQTFLQTKLILKRYLEKIRPKQIVFQVSPYMFGSLGAESSIDIFSNDINDLHSVEMALSINNIQVYNTLVYSKFKDVIGDKHAFIEEKEKGNDLYIKGGYVERYKMTSYTFKDLDTVFEINKKQIKAFKEVVHMINDKGIDLVFVKAPISKDLIINKNILIEFESLIKSEGEYYDFNLLLSLNNDYFYDSNHLNINGVDVYGASLIEVLNIGEK
ncbi:hypothetical protein [Dokdonia sp.]|uniref:hypothetical protein n=1 Tax=Dokdonia sp. TaxID=2024995 RepID=UPI0032669703